MDNRLSQITFSIVFALLLVACQSDPAFKVFDNKQLQPTQYAKLESPTGILILEIDGKELEYAAQYHILPGKRQLHVMVSAFEGEQAYKVGNIDISFTAVAQHKYLIKSINTKIQSTKDFNKKSNNFLWIEDITLDTVVAGRKP